MVKDDAEIALLRRACEITDEALAAVLAQVRPGLHRAASWRSRWSGR